VANFHPPSANFACSHGGYEPSSSELVMGSEMSHASVKMDVKMGVISPKTWDYVAFFDPPSAIFACRTTIIS